MGNSGSINGLSAYDDGYHPHHHHHHHQNHPHGVVTGGGGAGYHQHHQRYHDAMRGGTGMGALDGAGPGWLESYHQQRPDQQHHDLHWNSSSTGAATHHQRPEQQQIKVLPDIPGKVAKLRSTNNGNILHAGGTISKNNQLQRSKSISSPSYQQHQQHTIDETLEMGSGGELMSSLPPRMLITRSRTQVSMLGVGAVTAGYGDGDTSSRRPPQFGARSATRQPASYQSGNAGATSHGPGFGGQRKRFGSEPDLRAPHEGQPKNEHGEAVLRTPKTAQSKIMKGKNKKKAPGPPISAHGNEKQQKDPGKGESGDRGGGGRIIAYSPLRKTNSDTSSTLPSTSTDQSGGGGGGRKLRLFKTRAETRKQPVIVKLPEASDAKFAAKVQQNSATGGSAGALPAPAAATSHKVSGRVPIAGGDRVVLEQIPAHPNPRSFFRREKTFDVGLLSLEARKVAKPTLSPPLSRRKSIVKSLLEAEPQLEDQALEKRQRSIASQPAVASMAARKETTGAQARRKPSQSQGGKEGETIVGRYPPVARPVHPGKGAPNTLVIPVEPAEQAEAVDRDSLPVPTAAVPPSPSPPPPPPPPPPPKSSFYFGMSTGAAPNSALAGVGVPHDEEQERDRGTTEEEEEEEEDQDQPEKGQEQEQPLTRTGSLDEIDRTQMDIIDRFAASLLHDSRRFHSTDSVASSDGGGGLGHVNVTSGHLSPTDESATSAAGSDGQEIALRLRPTLPRKQFDIPRFSPAAAWRLLTTEDEFGVSDTPGSTGPGPEGGAQDKKQSASQSYLRGGTELDERGSSEDRIERVYREPGLPGLQDNKSGDSGISGDAEGLPDLLGESREPTGTGLPHRHVGKKGGRHDPSSPLLGSSTEEQGDGGRQTNNNHNNNNNGWSSSALTRLTPWTPQQDLDDDDDTTTGGSSSDEQHQHQHQHNHHHNHHREHRLHHLLDDSGDFTTKGHLFSLSLPRENHLSIYNAGGSADDKIEKHVFNSLQKLRKSVSDAFRSEDTPPLANGGPAVVAGSNDNWFLGRLDTTKGRTPAALTGGVLGSYDAKRAYGLRAVTAPDLAAGQADAVRGLDGGETLDTTPLRSGPKITSSSIGYLVSGRHVMYLPKEPTRLHVAPAAPPPLPAAASAKHGTDHNNNNNNSQSIGTRNGGGHLIMSAWDSSQQQQQQSHGNKMSAARIRGQASERQQVGHGYGPAVTPHALPPHENKENLQDAVPVVVTGAGAGAGTGPGSSEHTDATLASTGTGLPVKLSNRRHHRFTFQSTIRQIEKRRVAERLSREAEIKEAMRLSELEAMRRVEEEFQRKRAREKASIRHQLRLFSMEDGQQQQQNGYDDDGGGGDDNNNNNNDPSHHPGRREESRPYDGKRSDPDGDSLPHQSVRPGRGLYRKRDSSTIERQQQQQQQQQYKRSTTQDGTPGYPYHHSRHNDDDDDDGDVGDGDVVDERGGATGAVPDHDNDGDSSSSLGYVDTRTPYISRIIQAKSSKSGGYGLHKVRAD